MRSKSMSRDEYAIRAANSVFVHREDKSVQVEFFWLGLFVLLIGILYVAC